MEFISYQYNLIMTKSIFVNFSLRSKFISRVVIEKYFSIWSWVKLITTLHWNQQIFCFFYAYFHRFSCWPFIFKLTTNLCWMGFNKKMNIEKINNGATLIGISEAAHTRHYTEYIVTSSEYSQWTTRVISKWSSSCKFIFG